MLGSEPPSKKMDKGMDLRQLSFAVFLSSLYSSSVTTDKWKEKRQTKKWGGDINWEKRYIILIQ